MKLAIISDIHGNYEALKEVLLDIKKNGINMVIFLGDLVLKGPEPQAVFDALKTLEPICWLKGNTELWLSSKRTTSDTNSSSLNEIAIYRKYALKNLSSESIAFLLNCPTEKTLTLKRHNILCVHGSPRSIVEGLSSNTHIKTLKTLTQNLKEDIILCGHTHIPFIKNIDKKTIFNPGSVGCPYDGKNSACYGIMNIENSSVNFCIRRITYPFEKLIRIANTKNFPNANHYNQLIIKGKKI